MKHINKIFSISLVAVFVLLVGNSCDKDEVKYETIYSELFEIKLEGQVGNAVIDYENRIVSATIYSKDYANIELIDLVVSKSATTSINIGEAIDFSSSDSQDLTITAETGGSTKTYTINISKFLSPSFVGNWTMSTAYEDPVRFHQLWVTSWWEENHVDAFNLVDSWWNPWGQGEFWSCEWGGEYCYDVFTNGVAAMDNTLTIGELQGVTEDLIMYGDFTYGPGADGEMGSFEHTNATTGIEYDYNDSYSVMPSIGTWELNLTSNRLEFFNSDKTKSVKTFITGSSPGEFSDLINDGTKILGNGFAGLEYGYDVLDGKFYLFLEIDRTNLSDQMDAFYRFGFEAPWNESEGLDATHAKIEGGFALEFRMVKSN